MRLTTSGETPVHGSSSSSTGRRRDGSRAAAKREIARPSAAPARANRAARCRANTPATLPSIEAAELAHRRRALSVRVEPQVLLRPFARALRLAGERPRLDLAGKRVLRKRAARRERTNLGEALCRLGRVAERDERAAEGECGDRRARIATVLREHALEEGD